MSVTGITFGKSLSRLNSKLLKYGSGHVTQIILLVINFNYPNFSVVGGLMNDWG